MKTNLFKRHLAFFLSTVFISGSTPSLAVKQIFNVEKVLNSDEKKSQKCRSNAENDLFSCFIIEDEHKNDFYIRKRKTHKKISSYPIFGTIAPKCLVKNWNNPNIRCLNVEELLPSTTKNPCTTLYPFLVGALLRFVPYLLKPYQGKDRKSPSTYYLSFAHSYRSAPASIFIHRKNLPMLLPNDTNLRSSLNEILLKTYVDSNNESWTGAELANITIYLHANRVSCDYENVYRSRDIMIDKFNKMLNNKINVNRNVANMVDPLIDIYYKTSKSKVQNYSNKKVSQAYKNFYLDIVKVIDPVRAHLFQLLDDDTNELKLDNKNQIFDTIITSYGNNNVDIDKDIDDLECNCNSKKKKNKFEHQNKRRIRGNKNFQRSDKNCSHKRKNFKYNTTQNKLIRPVFTDMYDFPW